MWSDFIFNSIDKLPFIYVYINFKNNTVNIISPSILSFDIQPMSNIILNRDDLFIKKLYIFDKSQLQTIYDNYYKMKDIISMSENITFSNKLFLNTDNVSHNLYNNDIVMTT